MVIQRKGKATKWQKIQNAIKDCTEIKEVYERLDCSAFKLTFEEMRNIAQNWQTEKTILARHGIGI